MNSQGYYNSNSVTKRMEKAGLPLLTKPLYFLTDSEKYERLQKPFPQESLVFRIAQKVTDGFLIKAEPNPQALYDLFMELFYPGNWQMEIEFSGEFSHARVKIGLFLYGGWLWKEASADSDSAEENPFETAFKKTAALWGAGAYLEHIHPIILPEAHDGSVPNPRMAFSLFPSYAVPATADLCTRTA